MGFIIGREISALGAEFLKLTPIDPQEHFFANTC